MRKQFWLSILGASFTIACAQGIAGTADSTLTYVSQMGATGNAETVVFALASGPAINCAGYQEFVISPGTVPDAQSRKNMFALLLTAKATGAAIRISFSNADGSGFCESGRAGVYWI